MKKAWIICPIFMITLLALVAMAVIRLRRIERRVDALRGSTVERS